MKPSLTWAILGTVWLAMLLAGGLGYVALSRRPVAPVGPVVPSADVHLQTIAAIAAQNRAGAKDVAKAYSDFAAVLERQETVVTSKSAFRSAHQRFQQALWANDPNRPQLPGFSAAANAYVLAKMGADDGAFDATARAATVAALRDIAKALGG